MSERFTISAIYLGYLSQAYALVCDGVRFSASLAGGRLYFFSFGIRSHLPQPHERLCGV